MDLFLIWLEIYNPFCVSNVIRNLSISQISYDNLGCIVGLNDCLILYKMWCIWVFEKLIANETKKLILFEFKDSVVYLLIAYYIRSLEWRQMSVMTSQISGHSRHCVFGGFPAQRASNAENASMSWRHVLGQLLAQWWPRSSPEYVRNLHLKTVVPSWIPR